MKPIYGFQSLDTIPFRCATSTGGNGSGRSVYYTEEQVVDLNELISVNNQTVKLPNDFVINGKFLIFFLLYYKSNLYYYKFSSLVSY